MSVDITNVTVLDNPTSFTNPMQFEITFECVAPLSDDLGTHPAFLPKCLLGSLLVWVDESPASHLACQPFFFNSAF